MPSKPSITNHEFKEFAQAVFSSLHEGSDSFDLLAICNPDNEGVLPRLSQLYEEFARRAGNYLTGLPEGSQWGRQFCSIVGTTEEHPDGSVSVDVICQYKYSYVLDLHNPSIKNLGSPRQHVKKIRIKRLKPKSVDVSG